MNCPELLRTQAWLDGELDGAAAAEAERHVESCAECKAFSADAAELSDAIRRDVSHHRAPDGLRARIRRALDAESRPRRRGFWYGAAGGAGITALAASLVIAMLLPPLPSTLSQSIVDAHVRALMSRREVAVASSSHHTVKPWFAGRVALSPPVGDYAAQGFALAGGRVDRVAGAESAVVVYRHGAHEIDLFVWPDRGSHLPGETTVRGYRAIFWKSGDLDFSAVSDMEIAEIRKFVSLVRAQRE